MSRRRASLAIGALVLVSVGLVFSWSLAQSRQRRTRASPDTLRLARGPSSSGFSFGPMLGLGLEPRLFVTLSARTGPFLVSVRQIWTADREAGLLFPFRARDKKLGPCMVVLQVLEPGGPETPTYRIDTSGLRIYDAAGRLLKHRPIARDGREMTPLGAGAFCLIDISAPEGEFLSRIEGVVVDSKPDRTERTYRFTLTDVPLPNTQRVFGDMAVHYVEGRPAAQFGPGLVVLGAKETRKLVPALSQHPGSAVLPRQRILLALRRPAAIREVLLGVPELRLRADRSDYGAISLEIGLAKRTWRGTVWSGDPLAIIAPGTPGAARTVFLMRLRRVFEEPLLSLTTPSAFPAAANEAGGSITSSVVANGQRVTRAVQSVRVWRMEGASLNGPRTMRVALDEDGVMTLPNLRPGRYLLVRQPDKLEPTAVLPDEDVEQYLRIRYGLRDGAWANRVLEVEVRGGTRVEAPPLEWRQGADAIAEAAREEEYLRLRGIVLGPRPVTATSAGS